jgi:hypothetical protein
MKLLSEFNFDWQRPSKPPLIYISHRYNCRESFLFVLSETKKKIQTKIFVSKPDISCVSRISRNMENFYVNFTLHWNATCKEELTSRLCSVYILPWQIHSSETLLFQRALFLSPLSRLAFKSPIFYSSQWDRLGYCTILLTPFHTLPFTVPCPLYHSNLFLTCFLSSAPTPHSCYLFLRIL